MGAAGRTVHGEGRPGKAPGRSRPGAVSHCGTSLTSGAAPVLPVYELPLRLAPRLAAERLWEAWQALERWEAAADDELGEALGELLLVLWSVHRLGVTTEGRAALDELVDEELHPTFGNAVLQDLVGVSFALGAAWADRRRVGGTDLGGQVVPLR